MLLEGEFDLARRFRFISDGLFFGPPDHEITDNIPFASALGIWGAALIFGGDRPAITMLMDVSRGVDRNEFRRAFEVGAASEVLSIVFREQVKELGDVYVLGIETPESHQQAGDRCKAAQQGTFGAPVIWGNGRRGVLLSGHVAGAVGNSVRTDGWMGQQVGNVVASLDPATSQTGADVAVAELDSGVAFSAGFAGSTQLGDQAPLSVITSSGSVHGNVMGLAAWVRISKSRAHANLYMTSQQITARGDSGAPAINPNTNELAGHVVGASKNTTSYIQTIDYQLATLRTLTGFSGITV